MPDTRDALISGFLAAWETVVDLPLNRRTAASRPPEWAAVFFPLIGVLFGAVVLIAGLLGRLFFNPLAGAVIFAILGVILWEIRDSGRGSRLLATFLGERFRGTAWQEALDSASADPDGITIQPAAPIYWILLAARFLVLLALGAFGAESWLTVVFVCGFSLQGAFALLPAGADGTALFPGGERGARAMLGALVLIGVCFFLRFPAGILAAGILFYAVRQKGASFLREAPEAVNDRIALLSAGAELLWLLLGFLLAL